MREFVPAPSPEEAPVEPIDSYQMLICLKVATDRTTKVPIRITTTVMPFRERVATIGAELEKHALVFFSNLLLTPYQ